MLEFPSKRREIRAVPGDASGSVALVGTEIEY